MQRSTSLFFLLALCGGFLLFKVKYEVVDLEQKLTEIDQQIKREQETIHILKAEWSYLNEPQRLQKLAEKYLDLVPMKTEQIAAFSREFNDTQSLKNSFPQPHFTSMKASE